MKRSINEVIRPLLTDRLNALAACFGEKFDAIGIIGDLVPGIESAVRDMVEAAKKDASNGVVIMLDTGGGTAEVVERMVSVIRFFYTSVFFVIPDRAMSAGTIFAMSGDKIFMDYFSCLGPIDAQEPKDGKFISVSGYLRQFDDLKVKSIEEELSPAEFALLDKLDLGELEDYAEAEKLAKKLLVDWLMQYQGKQEKQAEHIAGKLSDNREWHSHGRPIGMDKISEMGVNVEDFGQNPELKRAIREYFFLAGDFMRQSEIEGMVQMNDQFRYA